MASVERVVTSIVAHAGQLTATTDAQGSRYTPDEILDLKGEIMKQLATLKSAGERLTALDELRFERAMPLSSENAAFWDWYVNLEKDIFQSAPARSVVDGGANARFSVIDALQKIQK